MKGGHEMKKRNLIGLAAGSLIVASVLFAPARSNAGVNITIALPLPGVYLAQPQSLVMIPGTYVYFMPDMEMDIFFYSGYWYRPYRGHWYMAAHYPGPWTHIASGRVPVVLMNLPVHYRARLAYHKRVPLRTVVHNWRRMEKRHYRDDHAKKRYLQREYGRKSKDRFTNKHDNRRGSVKERYLQREYGRKSKDRFINNHDYMRRAVKERYVQKEYGKKKQVRYKNRYDNIHIT